MLYPNPAKNELNVKIESPVNSEYYIAIFDISGREVLSNEINTIESTTKISIDISAIQSGMYYLRIMNSTTDKTLKLVKTE